MEDQEKETTPKKIKYCKRCHAEIERGTKRCPYCGKKQRHPVPWVILGIIVAIIVLSIIFGRNADETTDEATTEQETAEAPTEEAVNEAAAPEEAAPEEAAPEEAAPEEAQQNDAAPQEEAETNDYIYVGGTFTVNGLEITFDSYDDNFTDYNNEYGWYTPEEGYKYVAATFTFKNIKSSGTAYISIYDFDCYADNELMEEVYVTDTGDFMNANLSPDRTKTFAVAFAVPINSQSVELEYHTINYSRAEYIMKCK